MGSKRNKQHNEDDFNIGEEEAELFYSLKNAFSNLVLEENKGGRVAEKKTTFTNNNNHVQQFGIAEHKAIAQQIDPDQISKQLETLFTAFLPDIPKDTPPVSLSPTLNNTTNTTTTTTTTTTTSSPTSTSTTSTSTSTTPTSTSTLSETVPEVKVTSSDAPPTAVSPTVPHTGSSAPPPSPVDATQAVPTTPAAATPPTETLTDEQKFAKVENEIVIIEETVKYMQNVLPPTSQRTLECLGKVTDQYVKGWASIENKADLRQKYCAVLDKIGGWWLDEFLLFPELSFAEKEKWLNTYLRNWTRADGQSSGIENETATSMRVAPSRRPTPPPSPPEQPIGSSVEYDEYIARAYQERYEKELQRSMGQRADSSESMEDFYLASKIEREEQEEAENRKLMSQIEQACAESDAKAALSGDSENAEMGDGGAKAEAAVGEGAGEKTNDEGMGDENNVAVKEESMAEDKPAETVKTTSNFETKPNNTTECNNSNDKKDSPVNSRHNNSNTVNTDNSEFGSPFTKKGAAPAFFPTVADDLDMPSAAYAAAAATRYNNNNNKNSKSEFGKPRRRDFDDDDDDDDDIGGGVPDDMGEWMSKHDEDARSRRLKRGRSGMDMDSDSDNDNDVVERSNHWKNKDKIQSDRFDLLSTTWRIIKNMQIVGSMRFELCKKCGMYDECVKIARALDDREKIMDSRLLARTNGPEKNDDELESAMKSMLHL